MLDVHPPHAATHSWHDFFIHIATIVVGLLIAVGLEQTVEAIHNQRERAELQASLERESRQILHDASDVDAGEGARLQWMHATEAELKSAAGTNRAPVVAPRPLAHWDTPYNPIFAAARSSGKLNLLSDEERIAYGEIDALIKEVDLAYTHMREALRENDNFLRSAEFDQPANESSAPPTREQLRERYSHLVRLETAETDFRYWSRQAEGATTVMVPGERNLIRIEAAERMFDKKP